MSASIHGPALPLLDDCDTGAAGCRRAQRVWSDSPRRGTTISGVRRSLTVALWFVAVATSVYAGLLLLWGLAVLQTGGSPHCDRDCGLLGDLSNDIAPWGMIAAILMSISAGYGVAHRKGKPHTRRSA